VHCIAEGLAYSSQRACQQHGIRLSPAWESNHWTRVKKRMNTTGVASRLRHALSPHIRNNFLLSTVKTIMIKPERLNNSPNVRSGSNGGRPTWGGGQRSFFPRSDAVGPGGRYASNRGQHVFSRGEHL